MLNIDLLPKKVNEINYFKKEDVGCTMYSYSVKKNVTIICRLEDFEIERDFAIDDKGLNMIKKLNPDTIELGDTLVIKRGKNKFTIKFLNATYPILAMDYQNEIVVDTNRLQFAKNFCSQDTSKMILNGVNVNKNGDIIATDSFIVFQYKKETPQENDLYDDLDNPFGVVDKKVEFENVTIPNDFVDFINGEFEKEVKINFNSSSCMVEKDNIKYISRLIEGKYPDISRLMDNISNGNKIVYDYDEFMEKFNYAKYVGENIDHSIYLTFNNANLIAFGDNKFEATFDKYTQDVDYKFSLSFEKLETLINCLTKEDEIKMTYLGTLSPLYISNNNNNMVILPIKKD